MRRRIAALWAARPSAELAARIVLGALACAGLVVGAFIAWRNDSAAVLLVVSLVVLLVATLGPRLARLQAGGVTAEFVEQIEEHIATVQETPELPARAQADLQEIRDELAALLVGTPSPSSGVVTQALKRRIAELQAVAANQRGFTATHKHSAGKVLLTLDAAANAGAVPSRCVVVDPDGVRSSARIPTGFSKTLSNEPKSWAIIFPDDFLGARATEPGTYRAEWRTANLLGLVQPTVLAHDFFTYSPPLQPPPAGHQ